MIDGQDLLWEDAQRGFRTLIGEIEAAGGQKGWMQQVWHQAWHRHVTWIRWLKALERYCENQHTMALARIVAERAAADALRSLKAELLATQHEREAWHAEADYWLKKLEAAEADVARLTRQRDLYSRELDAYHAKECAVCPEDVGFEEYIRVLLKRAEIAEAAVARLTADATDDLAELTQARDSARLEALALAYHKSEHGEGEYGCNGATCPGVQRLVKLLKEATGQ